MAVPKQSYQDALISKETDPNSVLNTYNEKIQTFTNSRLYSRIICTFKKYQTFEVRITKRDVLGSMLGEVMDDTYMKHMFSPSWFSMIV